MRCFPVRMQSQNNIKNLIERRIRYHESIARNINYEDDNGEYDIEIGIVNELKYLLREIKIN